MPYIHKFFLIIVSIGLVATGYFYFFNSRNNWPEAIDQDFYNDLGELVELPEGYVRYKYESDKLNNFILYVPKDSLVTRKTKLVIVTHGGAFLGGAPIDEITEGGIGTYFLEQGYSIASIGYRLCPEVKWPTPVEDIGRGVQAVFDLADREGVEIEDVTYTGFSAGPTAGALLLYSDIYSLVPSIDRFISFGGSFSHLATTKEAQETIIECNSGDDTAESSLLFPDVITKSKTPALLIEGEGDEFDAYPLTERSHSEFLANLLRESGIFAQTFWARESNLLKLKHPLKTECIHGCGVDLLLLGDEEIRSVVDEFMKK